MGAHSLPQPAGFSSNPSHTTSFSYSDTDKFTPEEIRSLRNDDAFGEYVLSIAIEKVVEMDVAPSYKQIKYSKSNYSALCQTTNIVLKFYVSNTVEYLEKGNFHLACLGVECFYHCLIAAQNLYQRKMSEFMKLIGAATAIILTVKITFLIYYFETHFR